MKGGVGRIAGGGVMYATDTDHVGIPFVALLAPSEHRVRNTRLQSIMQTAVKYESQFDAYIRCRLLPYIKWACRKRGALCSRYCRMRVSIYVAVCVAV